MEKTRVRLFEDSTVGQPLKFFVSQKDGITPLRI
jgi:hypothetical protein